MEDIPAWTEFFVDNDRLKFLGIHSAEEPAALAQKWVEIQFQRYESTGFGHLSVELLETGEFIGAGGLLHRNLMEKEEYEVAYSLIPRFWNKGYGTEIAQTMKAFGFHHQLSNRLISIIEKTNVSSINVAQKNGMENLFETTFLGMEVFVFGVESSAQGSKM